MPQHWLLRCVCHLAREHQETEREHADREDRNAEIRVCGFQIVIEQFWLLRNYVILHKHLCGILSTIVLM